MTNDSIREFCLSLPAATEQVQWEDHLLFKVGGKMFAMTKLGGHMCNFRCTPEKFLELVEMPNITPTAYNMWKYHWVTCESLTALPDREFRELLQGSYEIIRAKLPKKVRAEIEAAPARGKKSAAKKKAAKKKSHGNSGRSS
jgi:predicted DNA-binding protein (MmcQ/YjbR family)